MRAARRDRARSTQIGIACELRREPGRAMLELPVDGGPRIRVEPGDAALPAAPYGVVLLGEDVKGEMWYRSDHQLGSTVDAWGNGLLIVSSADATPGRPKGAPMAILSTYHLDDTHIAELESRWRTWWTARFSGGG